MLGAAGYWHYEPGERLRRVPLRCVAGVLGVQSGILPDNARRVQVLATAGATIRFGDVSTLASAGFATIVAGLWIEVPPLCDRFDIAGVGANESVYVTALCGAEVPV